MIYQARCSRCGCDLDDLVTEQAVNDHGQTTNRQRRPNWGQARYTISAPADLDADGMGFNEFVMARLSPLTLPLCVSTDGGKLGGCFFDLVDTLEEFWNEGLDR